MDLALETPTRLRAVPSGADAKPVAPEQASDTELLVRVARRDREAFEVLYRRYVRSVFGLALQRLRDRERAEDATQETFAAVWRSAGSYRPQRGPAAPWLYAVARNAVVDRLRSRTELPVEPPDVISLETLPEREREVLELAYWSGLSQSEVASFLDIPLGTVKTRTRSALAHLADVLEGDLS